MMGAEDVDFAGSDSLLKENVDQAYSNLQILSSVSEAELLLLRFILNPRSCHVNTGTSKAEFA